MAARPQLALIAAWVTAFVRALCSPGRTLRLEQVLEHAGHRAHIGKELSRMKVTIYGRVSVAWRQCARSQSYDRANNHEQSSQGNASEFPVARFGFHDGMFH